MIYFVYQYVQGHIPIGDWKFYEKEKLVLITVDSFFYITVALVLAQVSKCLDTVFILEYWASFPPARVQSFMNSCYGFKMCVSIQILPFSSLWLPE